MLRWKQMSTAAALLTKYNHLRQINDPPPQLPDGFPVMGGQQNSPFAAALFQERCGFFHGLRVHAGEGFVQQQSIAPGPEGAEQGRTTLLPAADRRAERGTGASGGENTIQNANRVGFSTIWI